jgi:hypothetical protein
MECWMRSRPDTHKQLFTTDRQFESLFVPFRFDDPLKPELELLNSLCFGPHIQHCTSQHNRSRPL